MITQEQISAAKTERRLRGFSPKRNERVLVDLGHIWDIARYVELHVLDLSYVIREGVDEYAKLVDTNRLYPYREFK